MFDKRLLALLGGDKKYIVFIVISNLLSTVANIAISICLCWLVDYLYKGQFDWSNYIVPICVVAGCIVLRYLLARLNGHFQAVLGSHSKQMLRNKIYQKAARLGVRETADLSLASLTQVSVEGVEQLDLYYSTYIPQFFFAMISPFILFALLMCVSWPSAVVLLCCVPLIPASIIAVSKYAKKIFAKYWGQYTKMGDAFLDQISGMKELKIYQADGTYQDKMDNEAELFRKITMKVLTMQLASTTIMDLVAYGGAGGGIAIALANNGSINPIFGFSNVAWALFIVLVAVDFFLPLRALGSAFHVSMNGATAGKKILALLDTPEPTWGNEKAEGFDLAMDHVDFSYDGKKKVLSDVSLAAMRGQLLALVGESGCGKSTIVSLLSGIKQGYTGSIKVGDKELTSLSRDDYYKHMGVISYNTYLFNESIRANFQMANHSISDEEIYSYLSKVNLDAFVKDNGGLDLLLSEDSANISGGQRQRLALAVNLSSNKDIYLFDEVTSNIDVDSEQIIMDNIYALSKDKTMVLISHRLNNVIPASKICFLKEGKIIESGTHEELMKLGGEYAHLFAKQKELEEGYKEAK